MNKLKLIIVLALCLITRKAPATVNYPSVLDDNTTLFNLATGDIYIAQYHNNPKDAILAIEAKVGVDNSAVTTSIDYLLRNTGSVDPGHKHTNTSISFADGSAGTPGFRFGNPITDTNTGLFHPASGAVAVSASGGEIVRIVSTGVGIFTNGANGFALEVAGQTRLQGNGAILFGGTGAGDYEVTLQRNATRQAILTGKLVIVSPTVGTDIPLTLTAGVGQSANLLNILIGLTDTQPGVAVDSAGKVQFGAGGVSAVDTNLYRSQADLLKTDDGFSVGTGTTAMVNGSNDNFTLPAGEYIRITGPTGAFNLTGLVAPSAGGRRVILRSTVAQTWTITNQATSSAANQIDTLTGANIVCTATENAAVTLIYDLTATKWVVVAVENCATV